MFDNLLGSNCLSKAINKQEALKTRKKGHLNDLFRCYFLLYTFIMYFYYVLLLCTFFGTFNNLKFILY